MMKRHWFVPAGWLYRPVRWPGFVVVLVAVAFCVQVLLSMDRESHSVSDTLYGIFPFVVPTFLLLDWIAGRTGGSRDPRDRER